VVLEPVRTKIKFDVQVEIFILIRNPGEKRMKPTQKI
jgi:hypothetical protein